MQRVRHEILQLDRLARAARLPLDRFEEQRRATFALSEAGHQQPDERRQSRPALAGRHVGGKLSTSGLAAARAFPPLTLVLDDDRLDLGQLPNLMPQRRKIASRQPPPATPTPARLPFH